MDFAAVAGVLENAATIMDAHPNLNPDQAVRQAVFGNPHAHVPERQTTEADLYDEAHSLIEAYCGWQGNGIDRIPRQEAIDAARTEAARYRSYGGGT
ncbi:hypothetical protein [Streptomyces sp. NPDC020298]|uniref:hypothetical protein n=1 Tax=unclassified Streptomyces TaxID=2593676 RepID=UPI003401AFA2